MGRMMRVATGVASGLPTATLGAHSIAGEEYFDTAWNAGSATIELNADGTANGYASDNTGNELKTNYPADWLQSGIASQFEAFATVTVGTLSSGTVGSWVNLGTTRQWSISNATATTKNTTVQLQIRRVSDASVQATASFALQVSRP